MKKLIVLIAFVVCVSSSVFSQKGATIKGEVKDSLTGESLFAVTISIDSIRRMTSTDVTGKYKIENIKPGNYKIKCQYTGYANVVKEITINQKDTGKAKIVNFTLQEAVKVLEEVVITERVRVMSADASFSRANVINSPISSQPNGSLRKRGNEEHPIFNENRFISALDKPLSTFSVDADRASYSIVRSHIIEDTELPPADAVRIEEMINYFSYNYPEPDKSDAVSITTALTKSPWSDNLLLKVALKTKSINIKKGPTNNFVFLIDVSGSMNTTEKLPLVKSSLRLLVEQMREQDRVSLVVYAGASGLVLPSTPGSEKAKIMAAIDRLEAGGSTAGAAGIQMAYDEAYKNFKKRGNNRIILCTDGDFNVGVTNNGELERLIAEKKKGGVYLTVLGYGVGNYKDNRMEMLADKGNGNYGYVDNIQEAKKLLVNEMGATMYTVAEDVKLQIEFNPLLVKEYRLIGYETRLLRDEDFNNDSVDAGDMGAGHTVTALYEIVPGQAVRAGIDNLKYQQVSTTDRVKDSNEMVTIKFRYKKPGKHKSLLQQVVVVNQPLEFAATDDDTRFAAMVVGFGMLLRNSKFKGTLDYNQLRTMAIGIIKDSKDTEKRELLRMIKGARILYMDDNEGLAELSEDEEEKDEVEAWPEDDE